MSAATSLNDQSNPGENHPGADGKPLRVVILYKRHAEPDEGLMALLEGELTRNGHSVFIDRRLEMGVEWAREIEEQIRCADAVVPLISVESARSEMMGFEVEHAHEAAQVRHGRPRLLPVRVDFTGPLPEPMGGILGRIQYHLWQGHQDNEGLVIELLDALRHLPPAEPPGMQLPAKGQRLTPLPVPLPQAGATPYPVGTPFALESVGGATPLDSEFYAIRAADGELQQALDRRDATILIKGARQMGKTSLLARGLQYARKSGARTAFLDLQKLNASNLADVNSLYLSFAESLADQLDLTALPSDTWDPKRGANVNLERFLRREVLGKLNAPLVWGLDEVDRLFGCPFGSEVFGLFRSWHNERALDPSGPWANLSLVIAYATEAHLFITDINQSPFNVGTRLALDDFQPLQIAELNRRYGSPLKDPEELNQLMKLVGGHPYLVRRGLHELTTKRISLATFEELAPRDEGFYGDHLRRILVLLARDPAMEEVVRLVLRNLPCPTQESFFRLRSAGIVAGNTPLEARPRCRLYAMYLRRHLH